MRARRRETALKDRTRVKLQKMPTIKTPQGRVRNTSKSRSKEEEEEEENTLCPNPYRQCIRKSEFIRL